MFPGAESDFFRTRLTHSLEVSQIAEGIADFLNSGLEEDQQIDARLCATAGLVHDIGHPPFGHNGERALDQAMLGYGGFEGNAQTLRILSRLEKKEIYPEGHAPDGDNRAGLNLCLRTLGAIIKYDDVIPDNRVPATTQLETDAQSAERARQVRVFKGYYSSEREIVARVKELTLRGKVVGAKEFKTVECQIMDIADDIAYSVYDLEDCLKVRLISPASMLSTSPADLEVVAERVREKVSCSAADVLAILNDVFEDLFGDQIEEKEIKTASAPDIDRASARMKLSETIRASSLLCDDGYKRTSLSSKLVKEFIRSTKIAYNKENPILSKVELINDDVMRKIEVLKQYTYAKIISSSWVKIGEYRGYNIVRDLFIALDSDKGHQLLPDDVKNLYHLAEGDAKKKRVICDFVAGMTDRYALEFWGRLYSDLGPSMFKPV